MNNNNYVVIIAGGMGTRFWPHSKVRKPKQFLDVLGTGHTLLQSTFQRYKNNVPVENIYIISTEEYFELIQDQIPEISKNNLFVEPERKNTAPCIAYSCFKIGKMNPDANILIAPADHLILNESNFNNTVQKSFDFASKNDKLVTIGIKPTKPATGYGYIQYLEDDTKQFKHVKTFTEKPNEELAQTFLDSGDFLWNAGIFVWNFKTFTKESESAMPETYEFFKMIEADLNTKNEAKSIDNVYSRLNSISIDYALLEKSKDVCVIPADFEWSDLGTWSSLYELMEKDYLGNGVNGNLIRIYDASNNLIVSQKDKLTIIEGIENSIIVDTEDTLMILSKSKEQEVKNFTTDLKRDKLEKFL